MKLLQLQRLKRLLGDFETLTANGRTALDLPSLIGYVVNAYYLEHLKRLSPTDWQERLQDIQALSDLSKLYRSISELLEAISVDHIDVTGRHSSPVYPAEDRLTLSTIHGAKGREWRAVFVIGLSERVFPDARTVKVENTDEEARRLFHVAVTRAREYHTLSVPVVIDGRSGPKTERPSRFVSELTDGVVEHRIIQ